MPGHLCESFRQAVGCDVEGVDAQVVVVEGPGEGCFAFGAVAAFHGCRCEVGRNRSRSLDFGALNLHPRPNHPAGK